MQKNLCIAPNALSSPDSVLSQTDSLTFSKSRMFGEVKGENARDQPCAIDLIRLAKVAKDTTDTTRVDKVMVFYAVGTCSIIYMSFLFVCIYGQVS